MREEASVSRGFEKTDCCQAVNDIGAKSILTQAGENLDELCDLRNRIAIILVRLRGDEQAENACETVGATAGDGGLSRAVKNTRRELERLNNMVQELDRLV